MSDEIKPGVWMRLTETRRPDDGEYVVICTYRYMVGYGGAWFSDGVFSDDRGEVDELITHWLRLPPLPTEGDDGH